MRRRSSREVALSRVLHRPLVPSRDENLPQIKPDRRDITVAEFWAQVAENKRARKRLAPLRPRPRLLDPVPVRAAVQEVTPFSDTPEPTRTPAEVRETLRLAPGPWETTQTGAIHV